MRWKHLLRPQVGMSTLMSGVEKKHGLHPFTLDNSCGGHAAVGVTQSLVVAHHVVVPPSLAARALCVPSGRVKATICTYIWKFEMPDRTREVRGAAGQDSQLFLPSAVRAASPTGLPSTSPISTDMFVQGFRWPRSSYVPRRTERRLVHDGQRCRCGINNPKQGLITFSPTPEIVFFFRGSDTD